jgi:HD-GYP domain-containing protein (c-di-GMP phosphodiesterase class II)
MSEAARILVISRQKEDGKNLCRLLRRDGHRTCIAQTDQAAQRMLQSWPAEMLVLSVPRPSSTIRALARSVGSRLRRTPAIAVMTGEAGSGIDPDVPGLLDPIPTPFSDESFLAHVDALLRVRRVLASTGAYGGRQQGSEVQASPARPPGVLPRFLSWLGLRGTSRVRSPRPLGPYLEAATALVGNVEGRDVFDPGHAERVAAHCARMASRLGLDDEQTDRLVRAAAIHDIGKIGLPEDLLRKPSLTEGDRQTLRTHPRRGAALIRALTRDVPVANIVRDHHERPDGKGYYGRRNEEVSLLSRALAVADAYDGMTSARSGRDAITPEQAMESLLEGRGTAYDPDCVDALIAELRPVRTRIPLSPLVPPGPDH